MFWSSSADIDMFKEMVTCFISTLIDDICPTVTVKVFPYQKPWVGCSVLNAMNACTDAYNDGLRSSDMSAYKGSSYKLRRTVNVAK